MTISRRLRFEILRRDGFACRYCGAKSPDVTLTIDHVVPRTLDGGDEPHNLVAACSECNRGKSSVPPDAALVDDIDAAALLFARAMEVATARRREELRNEDDITDWFETLWTDNWPSVPLPRGSWRLTLINYVAAGLTDADLERYLEAAMISDATNANVWRYFCGCCRNEIGRRQELARRLIEDGQI